MKKTKIKTIYMINPPSAIFLIQGTNNCRHLKMENCEISKSQQIINEASKKVRDLSHNLVSSILLKFGLSFAIRDIVGKYSNSSLKINSDVEHSNQHPRQLFATVLHTT